MQLAFISDCNIIFDIYVYYPIKDMYINWNDHGIMFYPKQIIDPLTTLSFADKEYASPKPDAYCEFRYGKTWKIPKSEKDVWMNDATHLIQKKDILGKIKFYKKRYF